LSSTQNSTFNTHNSSFKTRPPGRQAVRPPFIHHSQFPIHNSPLNPYRGRLAPSPTGYLHLGHARTFHRAWRRARDAGGELVLRIEDLDTARSKPEFVTACLEDFVWMGIDWDGEILYQSQRRSFYLEAWRRLLADGHLYPCTRSRRDVREAAGAPNEGSSGPVFPIEWRPSPADQAATVRRLFAADTPPEPAATDPANWRFRVPEGRAIAFDDAVAGPQRFIAGEDFGDFLVWRRDDLPAYELAVVVDDAAQGITEVVRGADLLVSTSRQLLIYEALGHPPPAWCHEPLVRDATGRRLAKRDGDLGLRELRAQGISFETALSELTTD